MVSMAYIFLYFYHEYGELSDKRIIQERWRHLGRRRINNLLPLSRPRILLFPLRTLAHLPTYEIIQFVIACGWYNINFLSEYNGRQMDDITFAFFYRVI